MGRTTTEYRVKCKRCEKEIGYSGMMYEKMKEYGQSRPEYCEECRKILLLEKMTMGAAYFSVKTLAGTDLTIAIPGELGKVFHPERPHVKVEKPSTFDETKFGATPGKIVEIYEWLKTKGHQVVVVIGDTGSGKSTALPYWLIFPPDGVPDDFFIRDGQILITQPRIVATTSIADYMGTLLGSSVGKGFDIGYRYSKDRNADRFNAAFLATDGSLINMIKSGQLADLSVVMIDEAHERSLNIDIILRLLKDQLPLYPHLKLLIVSATINRELFLEYFGADTATVVEFEGKRKFEYKKNFAPENEVLPYDNPGNLKRLLVPALVKKTTWLLEEIMAGRKEWGHILAFLHGIKPIDEAVAILRKTVENSPNLKDKVEVFPLYSDLKANEKDFALKGQNQEKVRVIVSTNVAEASVTVDGVVYVIETGVENQSQWRIETRESRVELELISQANAKQRWGRSGRTRPGEVYCLYTEQQFNKMPPFPIPAIQRSSMDEIILLLKEMGVDDLSDGWIQTPLEEELNRSYSALQEHGAIDEDDMLTEYGALLQKFSYPAELADLVMMADRFGCVVEVATLLPVIKNGGLKSLLHWENDWDQATKQKVMKIHQSLWAGCKDDIEFILKMYMWWLNPPDVPGENSSKRLNNNQRREIFGNTFYINFEIFKDIREEQEQILRLLSGHKKDRNFRQIDIGLLDRVRVVLSYCLPCTKVQEEYVYSPRVEGEVGAQATYQLDYGNDQLAKIETLKADELSFLSLARELIAWEEMSESKDSVFGRMFVDPKLPLDETANFDSFVFNNKIGDEISVVVNAISENPVDGRATLEVCEPVSGLVCWLTPQDINFTQSNAVVKLIPIGTTLRVIVADVNNETRYVKLTCLPIAEVSLEREYRRSANRNTGKVTTNAKVIEVRSDGKVILAAEVPQPENGFVLIVHVNEKSLFKPVTEFTIGETYRVSFNSPRNDWSFRANLPTAPANMRKLNELTGGRLTWAEGKLGHTGSMNYQEMLGISDTCQDPSFLKALDYLYLSSNMIWARDIKGLDWVLDMMALYPVNTKVTVEVKNVLSIGAMVNIVGSETPGFVHVSKMSMGYPVRNAQNAVFQGDQYTALVTGYDEDREQVTLSLAIPENSPTKLLSVGNVFYRQVRGMNEIGAFVDLYLGYSGMIHISKMGRRVNNPREILKEGDNVEVEVIGIREERGSVKVGLRLKAIL